MGVTSKFLFSLPTHVKEEVLRSDVNPWGFYNKELTKNVKDWKEVFDVGPAEEGTSMQPQASFLQIFFPYQIGLINFFAF